MQIEGHLNTLSVFEREEIHRLLQMPRVGKDDLEQMWHLMDIVWDECGCDNRVFDPVKIDRFYKHPVWLLNGFFIEQHALSMEIRQTIACWIISRNFKKVLDYGGGFGTLARLIATGDTRAEIDIFEPHPHQFVVQKLGAFSNIRFVDHLETKKYDCVVSTDVLEHVSDPLVIFQDIVNSVKPGGYILMANCFYSVIKCHLPSTFHFRFTFRFFIRWMGLSSCGVCKGSHAIIYLKKNDRMVGLRTLRAFEICSRLFFPVLNVMQQIKRSIWKSR